VRVAMSPRTARDGAPSRKKIGKKGLTKGVAVRIL